MLQLIPFCKLFNLPIRLIYDYVAVTDPSNNLTRTNTCISTFQWMNVHSDRNDNNSTKITEADFGKFMKME